MATILNTNLIKDIKQFGAFDISACYNCGNCTAVCPLSKNSESFPRKIIRYTQIGMKDKILGSRDLWLCYYCGECSETCPREAEPGELMAAARRFAIANYEPFGLARTLFTNNWFAWGFSGVLTLIFALLLISSGAMPTHIKNIAGNELKLYNPFVNNQFSFEVIHWVGIGVFSIIGLMVVITLVNMLRYLKQSNTLQNRTKSNTNEIITATRSVAREITTLKNYQDCDKEVEISERGSWFTQRWFIHWSIMWGFIGLLVATIIDMIIGWVINDVLVGTVWIWNMDRLLIGGIPRVLGIISGLLMLYGTVSALINRSQGQTKYYKNTKLPDSALLWQLLIIGLTGFLVLISVYLPQSTAKFGYIVFLIHASMSMTLLILTPFSKLIHALYRPVALWVSEYINLK